MDRLYLLMIGGSPILGALLGTLALTLLMGRLTRQRYHPFRLLPLGLLAIPLIVAWEQYLIKNLFWELGALYSAAVGGAIFLGWLMGWRLCRRKECD
ncbi:hypothetical protein [Intestinimonas massiliensis (ex Afouda et al. 2020)]|uniref:hypothetical protein n=1 Tax=Intestinimonas massiliensis (ex Afouda et al. 2020) TaxID=1673721 RepID=UPI0010322A18|nr:hypothetical protein [Intestinimonas massiliensis (ex Afouda et al. 2020)]